MWFLSFGMEQVGWGLCGHAGTIVGRWGLVPCHTHLLIYLLRHPQAPFPHLSFPVRPLGVLQGYIAQIGVGWGC